MCLFGLVFKLKRPHAQLPFLSVDIWVHWSDQNCGKTGVKVSAQSCRLHDTFDIDEAAIKPPRRYNLHWFITQVSNDRLCAGAMWCRVAAIALTSQFVRGPPSGTGSLWMCLQSLIHQNTLQSKSRFTASSRVKAQYFLHAINPTSFHIWTWSYCINLKTGSFHSKHYFAILVDTILVLKIILSCPSTTHFREGTTTKFH